MEEKKKLRPVSAELVNEILNGGYEVSSYGCGSGSGSGGGSGSGCGCGSGDGSGSGSGSGSEEPTVESCVHRYEPYTYRDGYGCELKLSALASCFYRRYTNDISLVSVTYSFLVEGTYDYGVKNVHGTEIIDKEGFSSGDRTEAEIEIHMRSGNTDKVLYAQFDVNLILNYDFEENKVVPNGYMYASVSKTPKS